MAFTQNYGKMALIAGGPEAAGVAYAKLLAARGLDFALIAREPGPLEDVADTLCKEFPERING